MKLKRLLINVIIFVMATATLSTPLAHASGSGAGNQTSGATTAALTSVSSASNVTELGTAVQSFLDQYSVTFSTNQASSGWMETTALSSGDLTSAKNFSTEFIEEWSKYTPDWVAHSGLTTVFAVSHLSLTNGGASAVRCASYDTSLHSMVYVVGCSGEETYMRAVIHHEFAHFLFNAFDSQNAFDIPTWSSYNPAGFSYGSGGANTYGDASFNYAQHPSTGFVTTYAKASIQEDQAETYAFLFTTSNYTQLISWIGSDANLAQKVTRLKTLISSVDATMDDSYFSAIHAYAADANTVVSPPFAGPGFQAFNPDGDGTLTWVIPTGTSSTSGIGIGGSTNNQILILDGTLSGGIASGVTVLEKGTLMGNGTAALFIWVETGGTLSPGHSPGCLTTGNLTINGTYQAEIGGTTACTGYDQVVVNGPVDVTNGTLSIGAYNSFQPEANQTYTIINNDGTDAVTGTFANLPEGATLTLGGRLVKISYVGGDGNDVTLRVLELPAVPNTGLRPYHQNWIAPLFAALSVLCYLTPFIARRWSTKKS